MRSLVSRPILIALLGAVAFFASPAAGAIPASAAVHAAHASVSAYTVNAHQLTGHKKCCASTWRHVQTFGPSQGSQCEAKGRYYVDNIPGAVAFYCDPNNPNPNHWNLWVKFKT